MGSKSKYFLFLTIFSSNSLDSINYGSALAMRLALLAYVNASVE